MSLLNDIWRDAIDLSTEACGSAAPRLLLRTVVSQDSFRILLLQRLRNAARGRVPLVGHLLRTIQTGVYGIELGRDVELGYGVYFVHPIGVVIGGDAKVGRRVRFLGSNTVGTAKENGYPQLEDGVVVGAGARVLGPIRIGKGAVIGANAVVVHDIPAGATCMGIPASCVRRPPAVAEVREISAQRGAFPAARTVPTPLRD